MTSSLDMIRGRSNVVTLTNKSGGPLVAGDVCVIDTANDEAATTTTSAASILKVYIAAESIASNATGRFYSSGFCPLVTPSASTTRGRYLFTHTVAKQAAESATYGAGAFGVILKSGTTPSVWLFGSTAQGSGGGNVATDAIWDAAGDLAVGTGADTATRLAIGSAGRILGSNPSAALAWNGGMQYINEVVVGGGGAADITFSTITAVYRHLQLFLMGRCDLAGNSSQNLLMQFNSDTGSNYDSQILYYNSNSGTFLESLGAATMLVGFVPAATATANYPGMVEMVIPVYAGTTFNKIGRGRSATQRGTGSGSFYSIESAFHWRNTAAITTIKLFPASGNFIAGTIATLYGVSI